MSAGSGRTYQFNVNDKLYIRASQCASLAARLEDIPDDDWTE